MAIPDWLHISAVSGSGDTVITITADSYSQIAERITSLLVSGNTKQVTVPVSQSGTPIGITPDVITVGSSTTITTVSVSSVEGWEMSGFSSYGWISWSQTAGTSGNTVVTLTASTNSSGSDRVAHVNFCSSGVCVPFTLTQTVNDEWDVIATYNFTGAQKRILAPNGFTSFQDRISVDGVIQDISSSITTTTGVHTVMFKSRIPGHLVNESGAFYGCTALTNVVINDTITDIDDPGLFAGCDNLTAVTLSSNLKTIRKNGLYVFADAMFSRTKISSLTLPDSLEYIGASVFSNMNYLTGLTIPHGCYVESGAFNNLFGPQVSSVTHTGKFQLTVPDDAYVQMDGISLFNYTRNIFNTYPAIADRFELVDHVYYAGPVAICVDDDTLLSYTLRNGTKYVQHNCFRDVSATTINVPSTVVNVGETAFYTTSLAQSGANQVVYAGPVMIEALSGVLDSTLTLASGTTCTADGKWYLETNYNINSIVVPGTVKNIGTWTFSNLERVTSITIEDGAKYLGAINPGNGARNVPNITAVTIPDSIEYYLSINGANVDTLPMSEVEVYNANIYFRCPANFASTSIPYGVKKIATHAFSNCEYLESVTIPNTVKEIGAAPFFKCKSLQSITIPSSVETLKGGTVYGCSSLTSFTVPSNVKMVDENFSGCTALTTVTVDSPFLYNFYAPNLNNLNELKLGPNVKVVGTINANGSSLRNLYIYASEAPSIYASSLTVPSGGTLHYPRGADYSKWISALSGYNWTAVADL